ncbi:MAG TPA: T9SS type A sorting domain-containing protein, partial [Bacteroidetes bacterium]|nr:T9SS type A sorting domain-containing protein [Bacteroidota bacterium]
TDFLLLEISDPAHIENTPNTINHTPDINDTKVACIQHPIGDLKKIAVDNDPVIMDGLYWYVEDWQTGSTQDGSSGSPLFDANHQIVGQDSRGDGPQPCDPDKGTFFGRTDKSWFGNGTDESSLEPWLGGTRPPDFDKYAGENYFINGPDIVCDYAQFCNDNSATGNVHWTVSPHSAFYPPYEGNTSCANIRVNKNFNGYATITFTSTYPYGDCSFDGSIQKQFWIGDPDFTLTGDQSLCLFDIGVAFINPISPYTGDTQWSIGGAISGIGAGLKAKYKSSNQPGWGWICATMTNECGVTEKCIWVSVEDCEGGWDKNRLIISPVPSKDILYIKIEDLALSQTNTSIDVYIMDISSGKIINKDKYYSDSFNIDVSNLQNGVYLLKTISGSNEVLFSKFVVLK